MRNFLIEELSKRVGMGEWMRSSLRLFGWADGWVGRLGENERMRTGITMAARPTGEIACEV